jgi:hypothetical protein
VGGYPAAEAREARRLSRPETAEPPPALSDAGGGSLLRDAEVTEKVPGAGSLSGWSVHAADTFGLGRENDHAEPLVKA